MNKLRKFWFSEKGCLLLIVAAAFLVRVWGIGFGLPYLLHPDEPVAIGIISKMVFYGELNPHFFDWGSLYFYLTAIIGILPKIWGLLNELSGMVILGRLISVVLRSEEHTSELQSH